MTDIQPYDLERQSDIDAEMQEIARIWGPKVWTDEEVQALHLKEYAPGYYYDDPRYPSIGPEDRYLMDHPGPDFRTKPPLSEEEQEQRWERKRRRRAGEPPYDEDLIGGPTVDDWAPVPPRPLPKILPVTQGEADRIIQQRAAPENDDDSPHLKTSGLWICRVCRKKFALWPSERAFRAFPYGLHITVVFRAPIACTNCRVFEQRVVQILGHQDHRDFWNRRIDFWERKASTWCRRLGRDVSALRNAGVRTTRLLRGLWSGGRQ